MNSLEDYAYISPLRKFNPVHKIFISLMTVFTVIMIYDYRISLIVSLTVFFIMIQFGKLNWQHYIKTFSIPFAFIVLSIIALALDISSVKTAYSVRFFNVYLCITMNSIKLSLSIMINAIASISALYFLVFTTPILDLAYGLKKWRVPYLFIDLMLMVYKFIFILMNMSRQMGIAQRSRLGYNGIMGTYRSIAHIFSSLFLRAFKKTNRIFDALESRGYQEQFRVLDLEYKTSNIILIIGVMFNFILILIYWFLIR